MDVLKTNSTNGGSVVQSVENTSELKLIITKELTDYISAASHALLDNQLKVSVDVRENNFHPTCKPLSLMKYLITLITPPNGIVLDPFAGSGSTLVAAKQLGFDYIGIELTAEYIPIINARLNAVEDTLL